MPTTATQGERRGRLWPRRTLLVIGIACIALLALRLALPWFMERAINGRLAKIPGYAGHVEAVGIHLWRGAYSLHQVKIVKDNDGVKEPYFSARTIDFSIAWRRLLHGQVVSDIFLDQAQINFVIGSDPDTSQTDVDRRWQEVVEDIFPIEITRLRVEHGVLNFVDRSKEPEFEIYLKNLRVDATGLRNRPEKKDDADELPAVILIEGESLGGGRLKVLLRAAPLAAQPHFHFTLGLEPVSLPAINHLLQAYGNVDVSKGTFRLFVEVAARGGRFEGYLKPFFEGLEFKSREDAKKTLASRLWEKLVAGVTHLLKNKERDQLATRIPIAGEIGDPQSGLWATIRNIFHHGFVRALNEGVEGSVRPEDVEPARTPAQADEADAEALKKNAREPSDQPPARTAPSRTKK